MAIAYKTTNDPFNLTTAELLQQMWEDVGFEVTIDQIPQGEFIGQALAGNFQVFGWRNHAGVDPDQQFVWWSSTTTQGIALNFGRIISDDVDSLLNTIRTEHRRGRSAGRRRGPEPPLRRAGLQRLEQLGLLGPRPRRQRLQRRRRDDPRRPDGVRAINMGANLPGVIMPAEIFESPPD